MEDRDCADQRYDFQVLNDTINMWEKKTKVEEVYHEGCTRKNDHGNQGSSVEYCYCRDYLCNSADKKQPLTLSYHTDTVAVILIVNLLKYIQSL